MFCDVCGQMIKFTDDGVLIHDTRFPEQIGDPHEPQMSEYDEWCLYTRSQKDAQ